MGHPGNWWERKSADVRSENAKAAWALIAKAEYCDEGSPFMGLTAQTPCKTSTGDMHGYTVTAQCYGCRRRWAIPWPLILHSKWLQTPWREVVRVMRCTACDHPVERLEFSSLSQVRGAVVAKLPPSRAEADRALKDIQASQRLVEGFTFEPFRKPPKYG